ncbi:MAG: RecQ family ATP-dependent DNA helicase [Deltaproteobacteria bacterium]|jgi:ATP-dependent DNA helicase RecQ
MSDVDLARVLNERFGLSSFRPGQEEAIRALLADGRLLCIQPTGHGKSLLYQLPATLLPGITLVISPLLALVRDQVQQLGERFSIHAVAINSDQEDDENEAAMRDAASGAAKILFVSPERLDNVEAWQFLLSLAVDLVVVDEAHCISTWGHDFRPSYRRIVDAVQSLSGQREGVRVLGLTATASARTEADIARQLAPDADHPLTVMRASMDRANLSLATRSVSGPAEKLGWLDAFLADAEGTGILYCATRDQTEVVAAFLSARGHDVVAYHAGLAPEDKRRLQQAFTRGDHKAIAATNALGMGIDKADLRFIVHVDVPGSITAYYQEVGRAGRDGEPARGVLLFDPADRRIQAHFIRSAQPTAEDFDQVLSVLRPGGDDEWPNLTQVKMRSGLHPTRVTVVLAELREQGRVEKVLDRRRQVYRTIEGDHPPLDLTRYIRQNEVRTNELEAMMRYAAAEVPCAMQALRVALGDDGAERCGRCDRCAPDAWSLPAPGVGAEVAGRWLSDRVVPIPAMRTNKVSEGVALMTSEERSPPFLHFMKARTNATSLDAVVLENLDARAAELAELHRFSAVVAVPSRTWAQRTATGERLAAAVGATFVEALRWREPPEARQGELLNNDQRRDNVKGRLDAALDDDGGAVLLVDDYTGSGSTLAEAARALRKDAGWSGAIVPFVIAKVRWRLGARGIV